MNHQELELFGLEKKYSGFAKSVKLNSIKNIFLE